MTAQEARSNDALLNNNTVAMELVLQESVVRTGVQSNAPTRTLT
jgi:hypothetical protein